MHPTKAELWIYAARYAMDVQADIQASRSYLQRGLRFCKTSKTIYLEYARLEMGYVAKISARHKILGLNTTKGDEQHRPDTTADDTDADMIALPSYTAEDLDLDQAKNDVIDDSNVQRMFTSPAMTGAIPMAIFDASMKQFNQDETLGEQFFDMFAGFEHTPCTPKILQHVFEKLVSASELSPVALSCSCRLPLIGIPHNSVQFPAALGQVRQQIKTSMARIPQSKAKLAKCLLTWLSPLAREEGLAPELVAVLSATVRQLERELKNDSAGT